VDQGSLWHLTRESRLLGTRSSLTPLLLDHQLGDLHPFSSPSCSSDKPAHGVSYKVEERAPYLGERRAWIGNANWKALDRTTVETLVGGKV
jgi:hypothetical protein